MTASSRESITVLLRSSLAVALAVITLSSRSLAIGDLGCFSNVLKFQGFDLLNTADIKFKGNIGFKTGDACECASVCQNVAGCALFTYGTIAKPGSFNYKKCSLKGPVSGVGVTRFKMDFDSLVFKGSFFTDESRRRKVFLDEDACRASCMGDSLCLLIHITDSACITYGGDNVPSRDTELGFIFPEESPNPAAPTSVGNPNPPNPTPDPTSPLVTSDLSSLSTNSPEAVATTAGSSSSDAFPSSLKWANSASGTAGTGTSSGTVDPSSTAISGSTDGTGSQSQIGLIAGVVVAFVILALAGMFGFVFIKRRKATSKEAFRSALRKSDHDFNANNKFREPETLNQANRFEMPSPQLHLSVNESPMDNSGNTVSSLRKVEENNVNLSRPSSISKEMQESSALFAIHGPPAATNASLTFSETESSSIYRPEHLQIFPNSSPQNDKETLSKSKLDAANLQAPTHRIPRGATATRMVSILNGRSLSTWSTDDVAKWLYNDIGVRPDVVEMLEASNINGERLATLTDSDLIALGVQQSFVRISIMGAIGYLTQGVLTVSGSSGDVPPPYARA
ncbi:hypothetical protein HDU97_010015 [Phlyctochytrium planicorne]|nr:hypothetical protein HDU97_010015 [Phlyctochytrium planicorne]